MTDSNTAAPAPVPPQPQPPSTNPWLAILSSLSLVVGPAAGGGSYMAANGQIEAAKTELNVMRQSVAECVRLTDRYAVELDALQQKVDANRSDLNALGRFAPRVKVDLLKK